MLNVYCKMLVDFYTLAKNMPSNPLNLNIVELSVNTRNENLKPTFILFRYSE